MVWGTKIDLDFDVDSLRITDCEQDDDSSNNNNQNKTSVMDTLKRNSIRSNPEDPTEGKTVSPIKAETSSTQLRNFLNNLELE